VKSRLTICAVSFAPARARPKVLKAHRFDVKNDRTKDASCFPASTDESCIGQINGRKTIMTTATLTKWVRDPRNGQVHLPREEVTIMGVLHNLDRTLLKVRWQAGGECVLFAEELEEMRQG
jgi:hypothetical protein